MGRTPLLSPAESLRRRRSNEVVALHSGKSELRFVGTRTGASFDHQAGWEIPLLGRITRIHWGRKSHEQPQVQQPTNSLWNPERARTHRPDS